MNKQTNKSSDIVGVGLNGLTPNITKGGFSIPLGNNQWFMIGKDKRKTDDIQLGNKMKVDNGEVIKINPDNIQVASAQPMINGISPAELIMNGMNFDNVYLQQELIKNIKGIKDDGNKAKNGNKFGLENADYEEKTWKLSIPDKLGNKIIKGPSKKYKNFDSLTEGTKYYSIINNDNTYTTYYFPKGYKKPITDKLEGTKTLTVNNPIIPNVNIKLNKKDYNNGQLVKDVPAEYQAISGIQGIGNKIFVYLQNKNDKSKYGIEYASPHGGSAGNWNNYSTDSVRIGINEKLMKELGKNYINQKYGGQTPIQNINKVMNLTTIDSPLVTSFNKDKGTINIAFPSTGKQHFKNGGKLGFFERLKRKFDTGGLYPLQSRYNTVSVGNPPGIPKISNLTLRQPTQNPYSQPNPNSGGNLGMLSMGLNTGLGVLNSLTQGIIGSVMGHKTADMYKNMKRESTYVPVAREHINTKVNVEPQLANIENNLHSTKRAIDVNTNSSKVAYARSLDAQRSALAQRQEVNQYKENKEHELMNQEAELQTRYNMVDNQNMINDKREANEFNTMKTLGERNALNSIGQTWGQAIGSGLNTIGKGLVDYANMEYGMLNSDNPDIQREALKRTGLEGSKNLTAEQMKNETYSNYANKNGKLRGAWKMLPDGTLYNWQTHKSIKS